MKKIVVPIKRVPDYEAKIRISADSSGYQTDGLKWIVNPFDEIAAEEALKLREGYKLSNPDDSLEVVAVSVGPQPAMEQLQTCLAMGVDRAILVVTDAVVDSDLAHRALVEVIRIEQPDLVILGKQSIDSDANQTGQMIAANLDWPQATFASKVTMAADWKSADVVREVDGGLETLRVVLPAVVTTDLRLNTPRYASLKGIVEARKKPKQEIPFVDLLGADLPGAGLLGAGLLGAVALGEAKVKIVSLAYPPGRKAGVRVASVSELVEKLRTEAKVL